VVFSTSPCIGNLETSVLPTVIGGMDDPLASATVYINPFAERHLETAIIMIKKISFMSEIAEE
jgi:hypothetical protein